MEAGFSSISVVVIYRVKNQQTLSVHTRFPDRNMPRQKYTYALIYDLYYF